MGAPTEGNGGADGGNRGTDRGEQRGGTARAGLGGRGKKKTCADGGEQRCRRRGTWGQMKGMLLENGQVKDVREFKLGT